jgi:hypothetical protein
MIMAFGQTRQFKNKSKSLRFFDFLKKVMIVITSDGLRKNRFGNNSTGTASADIEQHLELEGPRSTNSFPAHDHGIWPVFKNKSKSLRFFDFLKKVMIVITSDGLRKNRFGIYKHRTVNGIDLIVPSLNSSNPVIYAALIGAALRRYVNRVSQLSKKPPPRAA